MTSSSSPCRTVPPRAIAAALPADVVVIDCGADHRLTDPAAWAEFYGGPHAGSWPYGLPELLLAGGTRQREALRGARRIAVPGCYPTGVSLALAPGFAAGPARAGRGRGGGERDVGCRARAPRPTLLGAEVMGSMSPYAVGGVHRHTPEMEQNLSLAAASPVRVSFTPTLAPMPRASSPPRRPASGGREPRRGP